MGIGKIVPKNKVKKTHQDPYWVEIGGSPVQKVLAPLRSGWSGKNLLVQKILFVQEVLFWFKTLFWRKKLFHSNPA